MILKIPVKKSAEKLIFVLINVVLLYSLSIFGIGNRSGLIFSLGCVVFLELILWMMYPIFKISKKEVFAFLGYLLIGLIMIGRSKASLYSVLILGGAFPAFWGLAYFLLIQHEINNFLTIFNKLVCTLALISFFFWLFGSIAHVIRPTSVVYSNWNSTYIDSYYSVYFQPQNANTSLFGFHIGARNSAIFPESPLATFVFTSSLLANEFSTKNSILRIILIVAVLSTVNTTSIVVLLLYSLYFGLKNTKKSNVIKTLVLMICLAIVVNMIINVIQNKQNSGYSFAVRSDKMISELRTFVHMPLLGSGFNLNTAGSSNSIIALAADGGILLWGLYYFPLIFIIFKSKNTAARLLALIFVLDFAITVVQYSYLMCFIVALLWTIILNKSKESLEMGLGGEND